MSWTDAERYRRTLRAAEAALELVPGDALADGVVPWCAEYADVFGTPEQLRLALLSRWRTIVEAQSEDVERAELIAAHPGLARVARVRVDELAGAGS